MQAYEAAPFIDVSYLDAEELREDVRQFDFRAHDIHAVTIGLVPQVVARARTAMQYAESHRGFKVGAAGVFYKTDPNDPQIAIYTSWNFKAKIAEDDRHETDVDDVPKLCAETDMLIRADNDGMERTPFIAVAATFRPDRIAGVMGVQAAMLHPCRDVCQPQIRKNPLTDNSTIVMSVASGHDNCQIQTAKELLDRYGDFEKYGIFEDAPVQRYSPHDYPDKRAAYNRAVRKARVGGNVYNIDPRREIKRRELAALALKAA
ncbi:MAG TPA: hypothetical protein VF401_01945 [Candidatus Saccharimonadales bacterium]